MLRFFVSIRAEGTEELGTFEEASQALGSLPRMFLEPDGSFVWTGEDGGEPWQVDGNLIDRGPTLAYMELKGACPAQRLDDLLRAVGWPIAPLAFELPERGEVLDEAAFRMRAAGNYGGTAK